ncbi:MAG: GTPase ObgE [Dehalococcoidales bacterium]|nr:MAG: GTPase ObgE [Dehalococcoidales bacterium]
MFDEIRIRVKAGKGGDGAVSFRREKYVPFGGPDGGDGGRGGDVVVEADTGVTDLRVFSVNKLYKAANGGNGLSQKRSGKNGEDLLLRVPLGTIAWDISGSNGDMIVADLEQPYQPVIVAKGGAGGLGNTRFATSTNQTPRIAQRGQVGEVRELRLEMRLIADVGVIGYPNVGKSTLLAAVSAARPKTASYPFTTLEPVLGVVDVDQRSFILAEIPGLVDGAHLGRGLGHDFLRHIMRTRILILMVDGTSQNPVEDILRLNVELSLYDPVLAEKPRLVAVNKVDLPEVRSRIAGIRKSFSSVGTEVYFISAAGGEGTRELMDDAMKILRQMVAEPNTSQPDTEVVFRPKPKDATASVYKEGSTFVIKGDTIERIVARVDLTNAEVLRQLQGQLSRMGVKRTLERAGIQPGDVVRCGDYEWQW